MPSIASSQQYAEIVTEADLSTTDRAYFGRPLSHYANVGGFPFSPDDGPLMRHSYVFQRVYQIGSDEYGGIQLRARIHTYGPLGPRLREWLENAAHRAAYMYDSGIETSNYGPAKKGTLGTNPGDGYLTGFNSVATFTNWEDTRIVPREQHTPIGVIDWSTEVYVDDSFDAAELSGIAQGLVFPFREVEHHEPGDDPVHVPPHKWGIKHHDSRPDYYELRPPAYTNARDRYREGAGRGKRVYVNGKYVGTTENAGRVWLKKEYAAGDGHKNGERYSRKGLVGETAATWQAIRDGGTLYMTGETAVGVYLSTRRARPDGWTDAGTENVPVDLDAREGSEPTTYYLLQLQDLDAPVSVECRRDDRLIKHLGRSRPPYRHNLTPAQCWPEGWL